MRRLMITTALVSLAFVPAARAELEVTVGGYTGFQAAYFDNDAANSSNRDFQSEAEIHVGAKATSDNGLEYGAKVEMLASSTDTANVDEASVYLSGSFGRVEMGDNDGAILDAAVITPYVGLGQVAGSYMDYVPNHDRGHAAPERISGGLAFAGFASGDSTKVIYTTPKWNGLQLGVSYAPEVNNEGESVAFINTTSAFDNEMQAILTYKGEISGVGIKGSAAYQTADSTDVDVNDQDIWTVGAQLSYMDFAFGGSYIDAGDSGFDTLDANDDVSAWNLGATYTMGAWGFGLSYLDVDLDTAAVAAGTSTATGTIGAGGDYTAWGLGANYKVAPGLTAAADLVFYDRDRVTGTDTDGYVFLTEVRAAF